MERKWKGCKVLNDILNKKQFEKFTMLNIPVPLESRINQLAVETGQPVDIFLDRLIKGYVQDNDRNTQHCIVNVTVYEGIWTAESDLFGLVTEADTYEQLLDRVWQIAPELAELNNVGISFDSICLHFYHEETVNRLATS